MTVLEKLALATAGYTRAEIEAMEVSETPAAAPVNPAAVPGTPAAASVNPESVPGTPAAAPANPAAAPEKPASVPESPAAAPEAHVNPEIAALTAQVTKLTELLQDQNRRAGVPRPQEDDPLLKMIRR